MNKILVLASLTCFVATPTGGLLAQAPSIMQLEWLVGEWTFEDAELDGEYRESGTRSCAYTLGNDYIVCESHGTNHRGRERMYLWYFNYNTEEQRFEITSLFEGYPAKLLYTAEIHEGGRRLELTYGSWKGSEIVIDGGATVTYDGSGQYVWGNDRFRDVVTRRYRDL